MASEDGNTKKMIIIVVALGLAAALFGYQMFIRGGGGPEAAQVSDNPDGDGGSAPINARAQEVADKNKNVNLRKRADPNAEDTITRDIP